MSDGTRGSNENSMEIIGRGVNVGLSDNEAPITAINNRVTLDDRFEQSLSNSFRDSF